MVSYTVIFLSLANQIIHMVYEEYVPEIILGLSIPIILLFVNRFYKKRDEQDEEWCELKMEIENLKEELQKVRQDLWKINKAFIVVTGLMDKQAIKAHPDIHMELEAVAKELLTRNILMDNNGGK